MDLKEFKEFIESSEEWKIFDYGISEPFSWRWSYDEVAFSFENKPMTREEILSNIQMAYTQTFRWYKGWEYTYSDYTNVNFESSTGSRTDGWYCAEKIAEIEWKEKYQDNETRLVKLAFV